MVVMAFSQTPLSHHHDQRPFQQKFKTYWVVCSTLRMLLRPSLRGAPFVFCLVRRLRAFAFLAGGHPHVCAQFGRILRLTYLLLLPDFLLQFAVLPLILAPYVDVFVGVPTLSLRNFPLVTHAVISLHFMKLEVLDELDQLSAGAYIVRNMTNLFQLFMSGLFTLQLLFCLLAHLPRHVMARVGHRRNLLCFTNLDTQSETTHRTRSGCLTREMTELSAILKNIQIGSYNAELPFLQSHLHACLQKFFRDLLCPSPRRSGQTGNRSTHAAFTEWATDLIYALLHMRFLFSELLHSFLGKYLEFGLSFLGSLRYKAVLPETDSFQYFIRRPLVGEALPCYLERSLGYTEDRKPHLIVFPCSSFCAGGAHFLNTNTQLPHETLDYI
ncbi:hypothetical protein C8R45DRAFT_1043038 [Mycena sanguinolenta]|nr:hypothetical protein C8R45DRAFT_1047690 [Mycena sanguinolenta]KAJ6450636.1 hypothetical protein C8R45DRAFT_1043038 [Mycena sanguinolenta]